MTPRRYFALLLLASVSACGGGGSGSNPNPPPIVAASAFSTQAEALPDLEPLYAGFCPASPGGRSLQHVVPADLDRDGRSDLVLFLWCSPVMAGTDHAGVTPSRIVVLMQDAQGRFTDRTAQIFGASVVEPGGVGEYYEKGDFNGDGYPDIVWSLQREDGRSINQPPLTQYARDVAMMSRGDGRYQMIPLGDPAWGAGFVQLDNSAGARDLVAVSYSHPAQGWTYAPSGGWTRVPGFDWVGGQGSVFFGRSAPGTASSVAVKTVLNAQQVGLELFLAQGGAWSKVDTLAYPASQVQKLCCNNQQPTPATMTRIDGKDLIDPSFGFSCLIRRTPSSSPEMLTVFEAQEIVGGYTGQVIDYARTPLSQVFQIMAFSPSSTQRLIRNPLTIRNEVQVDVKANRMSCADVNGDGYDDIVLHVSKNGQTPLVYLNDRSGAFDRLAASALPPSPNYGGQGLSNYILADLDGDGVEDLLYFPIVGTAGARISLQLHRGLRKIDSSDTMR